MKVFVQNIATAEFYNGHLFSPSRSVAFNFQTARAAMEFVREKNWTGMRILLEYSDGRKELAVPCDALLPGQSANTRDSLNR